MELRRLGRSDLMIAPLVLGGNVFGWTADEKASFAVLDAFVDAGFNAIDTADVYSRWSQAGSGASETVIGRWLKASGKRDKLAVFTKVGMEFGPGKQGLAAAYIAESVEGSLKRLQTDVIDLYQAHRDDQTVPQEETMEAFAKLVQAGKVRFIGCSNHSPERLKSANAIAARHGWPRYESEQPEYNLMSRQVVEGPLADLALKDQIGIIPFYGLASGFLTGKYRSEADLAKSPRGGGSVAKHLRSPKGQGVLAALDEVSARHGATPAQVALAWQMAKPFITAPIASATSADQVRELVKAAELKLSPEDMKRLDDASA